MEHTKHALARRKPANDRAVSKREQQQPPTGAPLGVGGGVAAASTAALSTSAVASRADSDSRSARDVDPGSCRDEAFGVRCSRLKLHRQCVFLAGRQLLVSLHSVSLAGVQSAEPGSCYKRMHVYLVGNERKHAHHHLAVGWRHTHQRRQHLQPRLTNDVGAVVQAKLDSIGSVISEGMGSDSHVG